MEVYHIFDKLTAADFDKNWDRLPPPPGAFTRRAKTGDCAALVVAVRSQTSKSRQVRPGIPG